MSVVEQAIEPVLTAKYALLVACSGGVDSMVLLQALVKGGARPTVLHVNYGLRGAESDADETLVRTFCADAGLEIQLIRCNPAQLTTHGNNVQAAARTIRRKAFAAWLEQASCNRVVLAHHADDQVETFFLQCLRGSGTFGLGGMHFERDGLLRPFLALTKHELYVYAQTHHVPWREDQSNRSTHYLRNLFRNELLPGLRQTIPAIDQQVLLLMHLFRQRQQELFDRVVPATETWQQTGQISCAEWLSWETDEQLAFLRAIGQPLWLAPRLTELASGRVQAAICTGEMTIRKVTKATLARQKQPSDTVWDFKIETIEILPDSFDKQTVYLDAQLLEGPLLFRTPATGDRIRSLGLKGSQLVSDVLKDAGVPYADRAHYPLLTAGNRILWIPGIKVARDALATAESREIWAVRNNSLTVK